MGYIMTEQASWQYEPNKGTLTLSSNYR